jgi:hypothetical protein
MNFSRISMLFLGAVLVAFAGCNPAPSEDAPNGDLAVQIPLSDTNNGENKYSLQTVIIKGLTTLREVRGRYAQFFYSPGLVEGQLSGGSPVAYFVKTQNETYVAKDVLSLQMATIYFHMQSLITGAQDLGITIKAPFQVGLNTQIKGDESVQTNNAFFDGRSKAMLFVPYTAHDMPISANAGIIAHEFFHSIFYSKVLAPLAKKRVSISQRLSDQNVHSLEGWAKRDLIAANLSDVELFNETYLRGINEGLADFWGWAYTDDPDFLKWSLPAHVKARSLNKPAVATYKTDREIENAVDEAQTIADDPGQALSNFIYEVGTPYARFLKELVSVKVQNEGLTRVDAKKVVSQFIIRYIDNLGAEAVALKAKDKLSSQSLFKAVSDNDLGRQTKAQCELIIQYLNSPLEQDDVIASKYTCVKEPDLDSYKVVNP